MYTYHNLSLKLHAHTTYKIVELRGIILISSKEKCLQHCQQGEQSNRCLK